MPTMDGPAEASRVAGRDRYWGPLTDSPADGLLRRPPADVDDLPPGDAGAYAYYVDHSCDLTMRGGTTSGVVYPLAICELAEHYVFRSIGGASAGAIAAAVTAAAELGRCAGEPATAGPDGCTVRPGFAGMEDIIGWLTGPAGPGRREEWRLAQLFRPSRTTRPLFRVVVAAMQSAGPRGTGTSKVRSLSVAILAMVSVPAQLLVALLGLIWLSGPTALALAGPELWVTWPGWLAGTVAPTAALLLGLCAAIAVLAVTTARRIRREQVEAGGTDPQPARRSWISALLVACAPLLTGLVVLTAGAVTAPARWVTVAAMVLAWLVLTTSVLGALVAVVGTTLSRLLSRSAEEAGYGLVPGAGTDRDQPSYGIVDRLAGVPRPTGVPPLSTWLADRLDDLAGVAHPPGGGARRALTFGDLWRGGLPAGPGGRPMAELSADARRRVVNLELMTTNLSQGRPYRLPLPDAARVAEIDGTQWMFCRDCLRGRLPDRVVDQVVASAPPAVPSLRCPRPGHGTLAPVPEPWDMPVVMAVRMSLSLPGLISAVPLYCPPPAGSGGGSGRPQWFSDGGITSNFPIHFFDSLLPRWPTFGLNLQFQPEAGQDPVWLPPQDLGPSTESWRPVTSAVGFVAAIINTFLGWRDTMQSALPGFRGRIAHVYQWPQEGGTNLFMTRDTVRALAERGRIAGERLRERFTGHDGGGVPAHQTQTDRYRWIRMRLAMHKSGQFAREVSTGEPLYADLATAYRIPPDLRDGFEPLGRRSRPDPEGGTIAQAIAGIGALATRDGPLAEPLAVSPPINLDMRLTPRE